MELNLDNLNKSKIIKKETETITNLEVDICVVGSGSSGFMAAIQAAKLGRKVALVDSSHTFGGQAVNSNIGLFCGLYSSTEPKYLFTYGLVEKLLGDLEKTNSTYYRDNGGIICVAYDGQDLIRWIENEIMENEIVGLSGANIDKVEVKDNRIDKVTFLHKYGKVTIKATTFIDCTGDASLTYEAGLPCRVSDAGPVYGTQMVIVDDVDFSKLPKESEINDRIREKGPEFGIERHMGIVFSFPTRNRLILNMTHVETPLEPIGATKSSLIGKKRARRAYEFLKKEFPEGFENSYIHSYGQPGIRQTRWIVGRKQILADEVRDGVFYEDSIGRTTWPIEFHYSLESYLWEVFDREHVHYIPYSAMTPPGVENLICAGRCVDADLIALSSIRVMGPCMAMGIAAAHAADIADKGSVHEIDISELQNRVHDNLYRKDALYFGKVNSVQDGH